MLPRRYREVEKQSMWCQVMLTLYRLGRDCAREAAPITTFLALIRPAFLNEPQDGSGRGMLGDATRGRGPRGLPPAHISRLP
jgi:hypothetical protein